MPTLLNEDNLLLDTMSVATAWRDYAKLYRRLERVRGKDDLA